MRVRLGRGAVTGGTAAPPLNNIITGNYSAGEGEGMSTSVHFLLQVNGREEKAGNGILQRTCTRRARTSGPLLPYSNEIWFQRHQK